MASKAHAQLEEDQHAYHDILSPASTYGSFSPVDWANRHPRRRAPESDLASVQVHESPPRCFDISPPSRTSNDKPVLLPWGAVPVPLTVDAPFFRRFLGARDRTRALYTSTASQYSPVRHVNAPQAWPPRRDSLNAPTSGVR